MVGTAFAIAASCESFPIILRKNVLVKTDRAAPYAGRLVRLLAAVVLILGPTIWVADLVRKSDLPYGIRRCSLSAWF